MVVLRTVRVVALDGGQTLDAVLGALQGLLSCRGIGGRDFLAQVRRQVVRDGERQGEPALHGGGQQGVSTQTVRAVVHPGGLTGAEQTVDGRHLIEVGPQATHGVVAGRGDAHRGLVSGLADGLFVHLDQVGVALADRVLAQTLDSVAQVQVHGVLHRAHTVASVDLLGVGAGSDVTRNQVTEGRVAALQEVVALVLRDVVRLAVVTLLLRGPDAAVVTQRLGHQDRLGLPGGVHRQAGRVELHEGRGRHVGTQLVGTHDGRSVGVFGQRGHVVHVAVTAGGQHGCVAGVSLQLAGQQVAHDHALTAPVVDDQVNQVVVSEDLHVAGTDLAVQRRGGGQLQLLTRLATGVVGAGDLNATEGTGCQGAAVLAGERRADSVHVVNDLRGLHSQAPAVVLAAAVVAALDRVLGVQVGGVVIQLFTAGGVHTTLRSDGVRAARGVVVGEHLDVVAQLAECGSCGATGQAGADDEDAELVAVQRRHHSEVLLGILPLLVLADYVGCVVLQDLADGHALDDGFRRRESSDGLVVVEVRGLIVRVVSYFAHLTLFSL